MIIPGSIVAIITFPGAIIHTISLLIVSNIQEAKVMNVCYFRIGNSISYVEYEKPQKYKNL